MDKKFLKSVIHFHIGCDAKVPGGIVKITNHLLDTWDFEHHGIKPILRKSSSMTTDEFREIFDQGFSPMYIEKKVITLDILYDLYNFISHYGSHTTIATMCRMGFDVMDLIGTGNAIDKNATPDEK